MDEQPLRLDTDLAGVGEGGRDRAAERPGEIGVVVHEDGCVASKLEQSALFSGDRLQVPADPRASRERERREAFVSDEFFGDGDVAGDDLERIGGRARLSHEFGQLESRERRLRRGFQHDGATRRQRGRYLVADEVERKVERRHRNDGPGGNPGIATREPRCALRQIEGHHLATETSRFSAPSSSVDTARLTSARELEGFTCFARHELGEDLAALFDRLGDVTQDSLALERASRRIFSNARSAAERDPRRARRRPTQSRRRLAAPRIAHDGARRVFENIAADSERKPKGEVHAPQCRSLENATPEQLARRKTHEMQLAGLNDEPASRQ
jgi:hypothetical protein